MPHVKSLLLGSMLAAGLTLNSTAADASETTEIYSAALVSLIGHGLLTPAYVSVIYYAVESHKPMGKGWIATNIVASSLAGITGGISAVAGASGSSKSDKVALGAGLSVLAGTTIVIVGTAIQGSRNKRSEDSSSVMILPSVSSTQARDTTFGLVATGRF